MAAVRPLTHPRAAALHIDYRREPAEVTLARTDTLAVIGFGAHAAGGDPRHLIVPLCTVDDTPAPNETWRIDGVVQHGRDDELSWSEGGGYLFVALSLEESAHGGPDGTGEHAYRRLLATLRERGYPYLLRAWNYLADINLGSGDQERYRHFTIGRAHGMDGWPASDFPAATAIGRLDGRAELLVYALAARQPGQPIENPRQVSAYRYPREYGPVPPSFARAMRVETAPATLLISGTASVIGHATAHVGDPEAQAAETLRNLDSLVHTANLGERLNGQGACLKAYLRHRDHAPALREALAGAGIAPERTLFLHGDICRADLLLEIDGSFTATIA